MIIDLILDRKDGYKYSAKSFCREVLGYGEIGFNITRAFDEGDEEDIKNALCDYVLVNDYSPAICDYIREQRWLDDDMDFKDNGNYLIHVGVVSPKTKVNPIDFAALEKLLLEELDVMNWEEQHCEYVYRNKQKYQQLLACVKIAKIASYK